jgi:hypothetical protein
MAAQQRQMDQYHAQQQAVDTQRQQYDSLASQRLNSAASSNAQADSYRRDTERLQSNGVQVNPDAIDRLYQSQSLEPHAPVPLRDLPERVTSVDPLLDGARRALNDMAADKIQKEAAKGIGEWVEYVYGIPAKGVERTVDATGDVVRTGMEAKELWHQLTSDDTSQQQQGADGAVALVAEHSFTDPRVGKFVAMETRYLGHLYSNEIQLLDAAYATSQGEAPDAQGQAMLDDPTLIFPGVQRLRNFNVKLEMGVARFRSLIGLGN